MRQYPVETQAQHVQARRLYAELRILESFPSSYLISKRQSHFGIVIRVELTSALLQGLQVDSVAFDIHLSSSFPRTAPIVNSVTHFTSPTIADGRDLLESVLKAQWNSDSSLYDVVSALPDFVKHCLTEVSPVALSIDVGTFHLGHNMYFSQWAGRDTLGYFSCTELTGKKEAQRAVVVTESVILQLEPSPTYIGTGTLLSWATLQSLANIKRSKRNPQRVTFDWKAIKDCAAYSQTFAMEDASACIALITANMSRLGVLVRRANAIIEPTLKEEEVTKRSLKDIHINDVLHAIAVYEANINEKLTLEMVNSLMGLYQKAIEYFSGVGDPRYDEFLDRMHYMLSNESIQRALAGEDPVVAETPQRIEIAPVIDPLARADSGDLIIETPVIPTFTSATASQGQAALKGEIKAVEVKAEKEEAKAVLREQVKTVLEEQVTAVEAEGKGVLEEQVTVLEEEVKAVETEAKGVLEEQVTAVEVKPAADEPLSEQPAPSQSEEQNPPLAAFTN